MGQDGLEADVHPVFISLTLRDKIAAQDCAQPLIAIINYLLALVISDS